MRPVKGQRLPAASSLCSANCNPFQSGDIPMFLSMILYPMRLYYKSYMSLHVFTSLHIIFLRFSEAQMHQNLAGKRLSAI